MIATQTLREQGLESKPVLSDPAGEGGLWGSREAQAHPPSHHPHTHTHTHTHIHNENRKQEQSKKSGERKLLRNSRAVLDVFRSVGRE